VERPLLSFRPIALQASALGRRRLVQELGDLNAQGSSQLGEQTNLRFTLASLDKRELAGRNANARAQILERQTSGLPNVTNSLAQSKNFHHCLTISQKRCFLTSILALCRRVS
jgi:hypothetical protein